MPPAPTPGTKEGVESYKPVTNINDLTRQAVDLLKQATYAVALTGAGISTPSGIPDFRSPGSGVWENVNPMEVASIYAFQHRPQAFYNWFYPLTKLLMEATPNAAHVALAQLETHGPLQGVITQNIDMLHTKAGSQTVYEVHGHLRKATCLKCDKQFDAEPFLQKFIKTANVPRCPHCEGALKPDVILFGELLPMKVFQMAQHEAQTCDLMLVAGSSLEVSPVADLPLVARRNGAHIIIVNFTETHVDAWADVVIHADVVEVLPKLAEAFI